MQDQKYTKHEPSEAQVKVVKVKYTGKEALAVGAVTWQPGQVNELPEAETKELLKNKLFELQPATGIAEENEAV